MITWFIALHPIWQGLLATIFTYLVTALGASLVFFVKKINEKALDIMLGFAAGVMIAASFWSLLSPAIEWCIELNRPAYIETGIGFLLGGLFVMLINLALSRISSLPDSSRRSALLTTAVTAHNIPEGLAVGVAFGTIGLTSSATLISAVMLAIGIGLQNFPEGVCVAFPLRRDGASRTKAFLIGQASGLVEPLAGVLGVLFALTVRNILPFVLSFSAGAMIAVVCGELIPSIKRNINLATLGCILGFVVMMVLDIALG